MQVNKTRKNLPKLLILPDVFLRAPLFLLLSTPLVPTTIYVIDGTHCSQISNGVSIVSTVGNATKVFMNKG